MSIQRGEIYFVNLNPVQGREQAGQRPVLVLSIDVLNRLPLVVAVVVGTKGENVPRDYPTNVRIPPNETDLARFRSLRLFIRVPFAPLRGANARVGRGSRECPLIINRF